MAHCMTDVSLFNLEMERCIKMEKKVLLLSNTVLGNAEDLELYNFLVKNQLNIKMTWVDIPNEELDNYDLILRRNTWTGSKADAKTLQYYKEHKNRVIKYAKDKKIKYVNLEGLDDIGKSYLEELYDSSAENEVIPTITDIKNMEKLPKVDYYYVKENESLGSGIGQTKVSGDEVDRVVKSKYEDGNYIIQPEIKFKSEVQMYFINEEYLYTFEYTPSKFPNYPDPERKDDICTIKAKYFLSKIRKPVGFSRIDFLKLEDDSLMLLEIEDSSPNMNFRYLDATTKNLVMSKYLDLVNSILEK